MSADGLSVVGIGVDQSGLFQEAFVATLDPVPEPSTYALIALGLVAAAVLRRRGVHAGA